MSQLILSDPTRHSWWRKLQTLAGADPIESVLRRMIIRHDVGCGTLSIERKKEGAPLLE